MAEWKTIDSAPNETDVLCFWIKNKLEIKYGILGKFDGNWSSFDIPDDYEYPTHWMELPEPPKDL